MKSENENKNSENKNDENIEEMFKSFNKAKDLETRNKIFIVFYFSVGI
jgi:hypothetical protein